MQSDSTKARVERKYALTRIKAGDYILPSNDGKTLWRICKYRDGPSMGLDPEVFPRDFERWQLRRWHRPVHSGSLVDIEDWDRWEHWDESYDTRQEAIDAALRIPDA
jgi:hypothetical protein